MHGSGLCPLHQTRFVRSETHYQASSQPYEDLWPFLDILTTCESKPFAGHLEQRESVGSTRCPSSCAIRHSITLGFSGLHSYEVWFGGRRYLTMILISGNKIVYPRKANTSVEPIIVVLGRGELFSRVYLMCLDPGIGPRWCCGKGKIVEPHPLYF